MKIGITCYPTYGGSGAVATELGLELARRGHDIHFISYASPFRLRGLAERVTLLGEHLVGHVAVHDARRPRGHRDLRDPGERLVVEARVLQPPPRDPVDVVEDAQGHGGLDTVEATVAAEHDDDVATFEAVIP